MVTVAHQKTYTTQEVAQHAGVTPKTLYRWWKAGKIPEPYRHRGRWRLFTEDELKAVLRFATELTPPDLHAHRGDRATRQLNRVPQ